MSITTAARHISASNLSQRLGLDGPDDELRELADARQPQADSLSLKVSALVGAKSGD